LSGPTALWLLADGFYRLGRFGNKLRSSLGSVCFSLVKGFAHERGFCNKLAVGLANLRRSRESQIRPTVKGPDCHYRLSMGETVVVKLFFYRSEAPTQEVNLELQFDPKAFTSASRNEFRVGSRYDEIRVLLSCARTPDPIYSALSIVDPGQTHSCSPEPVFVTLVKPPTMSLFLIALLFTFGLCLVQLSAQDVQALIHAIWPIANKMWLDPVSRCARGFVTLLIFIATWTFVRKFPLK